MPFRFDRNKIKSPIRLDDGRIRVDGVITRSGVFPYTNRDGSTRLEYRPPEEVFSPESIETFKMVPVTNDHPVEGELTSSNRQALSVGVTGENVRQDGSLLLATMMISDPEAVLSVEQGKTALSCGYELDLDETPGVTPDGQRYDAIQRNIRGNHVALVQAGRAGVLARIRMDAAAESLYESRITPKQEKTMDPELLKAIHEKSELSVRLDSANARIEALEAELEAANTGKVTAEAERDSHKSRADKAESLRTDGAELSRLVKERAALEASATKLIGDESYEPSEKSDTELRCDALAAQESFEYDPKAHDENYLKVRFDSAVHYFSKQADPYKGLTKTGEPNRLDHAATSNEPSAYERMKARNVAQCAPKEQN